MATRVSQRRQTPRSIRFICSSTRRITKLSPCILLRPPRKFLREFLFHITAAYRCKKPLRLLRSWFPPSLWRGSYFALTNLRLRRSCVHPESTNVRNDSKSFLAMCEELLERGHHVRIHARGESMKPNILDGDIVEVTPLANRLVGKGDIVLARTPDGLKLHRISKSLESVVVIERQGVRRLASGPIAKISLYCRYMAHRLRIAALRRLGERRAFLGLLLVLVAGFAAIPQT